MSEVYYNSLFFVENLTCQIDAVPEFLNNYSKLWLKKSTTNICIGTYIYIIHNIDVYLNAV